MNWIYTNILHNPRKVLGISVLEYCVLDYVYKTQTHPEYGVNGWTKTGCHKIADFLGVSSGTVKGIFDRMDTAGLLERMGDDLKRATAKFYSIAYEQDVQKLNEGCSKTEQVGVQKLNGKRLETEHYKKKEKESLNKIEKKVVELHSTVTLIDEVDETSVEIHHVPEWFENDYKKEMARLQKEYGQLPKIDPDEAYEKLKQLDAELKSFKKTEKKERKSSAKKKEKADAPTPIRAMFELYADKYAELNNGVKPEFMVKYTPAMKNLYSILKSRSSMEICLDNLQPWRDFLQVWGDYLAKNEKEKWHRDNFNPLTFFSQFNSIIAKLNNRPKTDAEKWIEWGKRQGL